MIKVTYKKRVAKYSGLVFSVKDSTFPRYLIEIEDPLKKIYKISIYDNTRAIITKHLEHNIEKYVEDGTWKIIGYVEDVQNNK